MLDEATSSLDTETEKLVLDAAGKAFKGRTVLTIAVIKLLCVLLFSFVSPRPSVSIPGKYRLNYELLDSLMMLFKHHDKGGI